MALAFQKMGVMPDCSRNAVMNVETMKKFISVLAKMGYNEVQLYVEDTYEVDGEEKFGYTNGGVLTVSKERTTLLSGSFKFNE